MKYKALVHIHKSSLVELYNLAVAESDALKNDISLLGNVIQRLSTELTRYENQTEATSKGKSLVKKDYYFFTLENKMTKFQVFFLKCFFWLLRILKKKKKNCPRSICYFCGHMEKETSWISLTAYIRY